VRLCLAPPCADAEALAQAPKAKAARGRVAASAKQGATGDDSSTEVGNTIIN